MKPRRTVSFHVDMDSPRTLLRFWGIGTEHYSEKELDDFYSIAMSRILSFFETSDVQATFFAIGEDLEGSARARDWVRTAHGKGHEIANHSFSHTFGLRSLSKEERTKEIGRCSDVIRQVTGENPLGFRSPSYEVDTALIGLLEKLGFSYDSSGFWSVLSPLIKTYHRLQSRSKVPTGCGTGSWRMPRLPYYPSQEDWQKPGPKRRILEIPVPRTRIFQLPFYNNFHLAAGELYRRPAVRLMSQDHLVYLFHLVEFVDIQDGIPYALKVHPSLTRPFPQKLRVARDTVLRLRDRYEVILSRKYAEDRRKESDFS